MSNLTQKIIIFLVNLAHGCIKVYSLTSLLSQLWDLAESWSCGGGFLVDSLGGGLLHMALDPLLTPTITLFNLTPIARSTLSWSPPNDPDSLSINSQITRNISWSVCGNNSGLFIWKCMVFTLFKHWWWLKGRGGGKDGAIIMVGNLVFIKGWW